VGTRITVSQIVWRSFRSLGTSPARTTDDLPLPDAPTTYVIQNKKKLLARISRIRGQVNGIERALNEERECGEVLLTLAACRGAMNALMAEILEGHVRLHLLQTNSQKDAAVAAAGEELIEVIKRYLK
jgi:DNA-binding FrmR family transcriptional regulator